MERGLHRRTFLRLAAASATSVGAALVAACGESGSTAPTATTSAPSAPTATPAPMPTTAMSTTAPTTAPAVTSVATTVAATSGGATPAVMPTTAAPAATGAATAVPSAAASGEGRIPAPNPNVPDAYTKLPPRFKSVAAVPLKGGTVTTFQYSFNPPPAARESNQYWQELEKRVGAKIEPIFVPYGSYAEKLGPVFAGGNVPDLVLTDVRPAPDLNRYIQQGAYVDLTPYLTGDALKEYPNLARFPAQLWKNAAIRGKLYGVPRPRALAGNPMIFRQDWAEKVGVRDVRNKDDLLKALVGMAKMDPDGNGAADTFGLTSQSGTALYFTFFQQMWRTPNEWRQNPDGTLTHSFELEESRAAVSFMRELWAAGAYHPDAANMTVAQCKDNFAAGKVGAFNDSFLTLPGYKDPTSKGGPLAGTPTANVIGLVPPGWDGGKGVTFASNGVNAMTGIPSRIKDQGRIKELLRVLDFYAAPFGSEERVFLDYGIEGVHYELKNGTPTGNDTGKAQLGDFQNLMLGPYVIYSGAAGAAEYTQKVVADTIAIGVDNPCISAYSPTFAMKAGELNQLTNDRVIAIVTGREPLAAWDTFVKDWRSRGGDQMRKEYQDFFKQ